MKKLSVGMICSRRYTCKLYEALKKTVQEESPLPPIELARIHMKNQLGKICKAVPKFLLKDAPLGLEPIAILQDGNCYPRSVLYIIFGTQERHIKIRVRMIFQARENESLHLNNDYLSLGLVNKGKHLHHTQLYSLYSGDCM